MEEENNKQHGEGVARAKDERGASRSSATATKSKGPLIAALIIVAALLVAGGMLYLNGSGMDTRDTATIEQNSDPDSVLAVVNGDQILQKEVDTRIDEAKQALITQGVDLSDPAVRTQIEAQIVDDIINVKLLTKGAEDAGVTLEAGAVDSEIENYVLQAGSEEAFNSQLGQAGLTLDSFREQLSKQLVIQTYISQNVGADSITVTDEEVIALYDQVATGQGGVPPLAEVRDQIEAQLMSDKQQQAVQDFISSLREGAEITIS
jgi:peptidyl-prolyl cis-trans isomerase SurA